MIIPFIVLITVFILIIIRQVGSIKLQIWQIMLLGAVIVLVTRQITIYDALKSINLDVMLFLLSMFIIGVALEESGYLHFLSYKLFKKVKNINYILLYILFGAGFSSAIIMNDTLAIIGHPMLLLVARQYGINPKIFLITLAFSVTIGGVISPIGNPQNFLIVTQFGLSNAFVTFLHYLFIPTIINLFLTFLIIKYFYKNQLNSSYQLYYTKDVIKDPFLVLLVKISLFILLTLIVVKITLEVFNVPIQIKLCYITTIAALPILILSRNRIKIIAKVDWYSLIFFAAMFVLIASVWQSGILQLLISSLNINLLSIPVIFFIGIIVGQLIPNVSLITLYLPMLINLGATEKEILVLAVASTIAGNLFILGAASNVIIIQNAENKASITITFFEFAKIGIPVTIVNVFIYWLFLDYLYF
ncbi:MAG: SLC13 family permease [Francisella sp.]